MAKALNCGEKQPAPAMKKMKRPFILKSAPEHARYICNGCGYEYDQDFGDPENEIDPGTTFDQLPESGSVRNAVKTRAASSKSSNGGKQQYALCKKSM
ncbi:MAG: rubredoxin [Merdibacter sp.]